MVHEENLFDLIIFEDAAETNKKYDAIEDFINFTDSFNSHRFYGTMIDLVVFNDTINRDAGSLYNLELTDTLVFSEFIHWRTHIESLSDFLFLHDYIENIDFHRLSDTLVFSDSMVGEAGTALRDSLAFTDSLSYIAVINHVTTDTLTFQEGLTVYLQNDPWRPMVPIVPEVP